MTTRSMLVQVSLGAEVLTSQALNTSASPDQVWRVLANGWLFPSWAIGATQVCKVDGDWPSADSRLQHAIGRGLFALRSETRVLASRPARMLKVLTEGWPSGGSELTVTVIPAETGTSLRLEELVVAPTNGLAPIVNTMLLQWRTTQALRGLDLLARSVEPS